LPGWCTKLLLLTTILLGITKYTKNTNRERAIIKKSLMYFIILRLLIIQTYYIELVLYKITYISNFPKNILPYICLL